MSEPVKEFVCELFSDDAGLLESEQDAVDDEDNRVMRIQRQKTRHEHHCDERLTCTFT